MTRPPPLALTLGDPAGIGPEIVVKAWRELRRSGPPFILIGDPAAIDGAPIALVNEGDMADDVFAEALPVLADPAPEGETHASAVVRWIVRAVDLALAGAVSGIVTAPISKSRLYAENFPFPGHTEFIADLTLDAPMPGARGPVMMLTARDLRVALVTIHTPLAEVSRAVTVERVVSTARVTHEALKLDFGFAAPRLALAGLNPHAGEDGAIGREEIEVLAPAVAELRAAGIDISDPRPADTLFHEDARKRYDGVVCLYHDQALIPVKTLDFWGGVNVTLGLPVVRTSPDHGTGFDIAGKGVARADSLIAAIRLAAEIAERRTAA